MTRPRPSLSSCARRIETSGKTAALVTPDRTLARRVAARLNRYDLVIDDSAGVPVARTVPGGFLDLVRQRRGNQFRPARAYGPAQASAHAPWAGAPRYPGGRAASRTQCIPRRLRRAGACGGALKLSGRRVRRTREPATREASRSSGRRFVSYKISSRPSRRCRRCSPILRQHAAARLAEAHSAVAEALARDATGSSSSLWQGTPAKQ